MGLAVYTCKRFSILSSVLQEKLGIAWTEPESPDAPELPEHASSFPYSFLHYLRRAYVLARRGQEITPCDRDGLDKFANDVEEASSDFSSHLLCHSDCEGYYVPVRFDKPLFLDESPALGGMIGSSYSLIAELDVVGRAMGITFDSTGALAAGEVERINRIDTERSPLFREHIVWLTLWLHAHVSVQLGTAIVFH